MRSLTPVAIFLMMMSVVLWSFSREAVMTLDVIALGFFLIQIFRRQKTEPIVFLAIIVAIIIMIVDNIVKK